MLTRIFCEAQGNQAAFPSKTTFPSISSLNFPFNSRFFKSLVLISAI